MNKKSFIVEIDGVFADEIADCIRDLIQTEINLANAGDDLEDHISHPLYAATRVEVRCLKGSSR